jgi:hypothetical protein
MPSEITNAGLNRASTTADSRIGLRFGPAATAIGALGAHASYIIAFLMTLM